jgi:hypothetical protein
LAGQPVAPSAKRGDAVPDWRNAKHYAYTKRLTLHQWAWEFLRRNRRYRDAWGRLAELDFIEQMAQQSEVFKAAGYTWGLSRPIDPALDARLAQFTLFWSLSSGLFTGYLPNSGAVRRLSIDLEKPIRPQLQIAEKLLRTERDQKAERGEISPLRPKIRPRKDLYPSYVQILDGNLAGAGTRVIGEALFPEHDDPRQPARDRLKAATKLSGGAYKDLLLMLDE